ncbi:MAG: penicillin acylase family protein, partial [Pseudomonadales bacterium]
PWEGELRFHEVHLTIPGKIDVAGVTIPGAMGVVSNGFNESMAWAHTNSTSNQFIIYSLDLVPGNPTRYRFGDEERDMQAETYTIEVRQADGSLVEQSRTLYSSHYGPMLDPSVFGLAWSDTAAYSIFDINAENDNLAEPHMQKAMANSVDDLQKVFSTVGGTSSVNTIATDRHGEVFYADATLVPNLSDEAEAEFRALVEAQEFSFTQFFFNQGFVMLDGSDPLFSIDVDDRATVPGAIPFAEAPQLTGRRDFVANSNDSYWLSNPAEPLSGYSLRYGDVETPRRLRARMGLTQLSESTLWDRASLKDMMFENRSYTEQLWRDLFVSYCSQFSEATSSDGETVDISAACAVLSSWDGRYNLESVGAIVFRELLSNIDFYGLFGGTSYFSRPFDPLDPVATPSGLSSEGEVFLLGQLADAVLRLQQAGISIDAPLGDYQYTLRGDQRFALHGGRSDTDGAFNIVAYAFFNQAFWNSTLLSRMTLPPVIKSSSGLTQNGYLSNFGSSFIMVVEFTDAGPVADAILTYSQSDDPESPYFSDQMPLYSSKTWRPLPFTREQIEADPALTSMTVTN